MQLVHVLMAWQWTADSTARSAVSMLQTVSSVFVYFGRNWSFAISVFIL